MTRIGINSSNLGDFTESKVKISFDKKITKEITTTPYTQDQTLTTKKAVISEKPFEKPMTINKANNTDLASVEKTLKTARESNNAQGIVDVAKIQHKTNILPNVKTTDLLREAYNLALSEMDSDALYDIGNFDAQHNLLKDVSSEHIFKMADMTRKIY